MQNLQDTDIIRLVLQGQKNAFAILVERYQHFVFTVAMRYVNNREEAEEIAQDVFVKAYRSLAGFNGKSKFSTWLYAIAHHTCLSALRKAKSPAIPVDVLPAHAAVAPASERLDSRSTQALVNAAIARLDEQDAEIITLFYQAEQTLEEIALITGQTPNNVKVRLFRARQKLKTILEKQYPGWHVP